MGGSFFDGTGKIVDPNYAALATPECDRHQSAADFVEQLFQRNHELLGPDLRANARGQFHQCFWELYLADGLRSGGLLLATRNERTSPAGPDFLVAKPRVWIEAVAPQPGTGPDSVPRLPFDGKAHRVPESEIKLRYLNAIDSKNKAVCNYREKQFVLPSEPYVVALNGGAVSKSGDYDPPRIVRTLFGVSWPVAHFDLERNAFTRTSYALEPTVQKRSGDEINARTFLDGTYTGVSAVLFSGQTVWNSAPNPGSTGVGPGSDFIVVHNATAENPLPRGLLPCAAEYQLEGDAVIRL